jgi:hypothetical protein
MALRTLSDWREAMRQQPTAHRVPATTAIRVETVAIHKLCQMLESHSRLPRKVRQCCSDRPSSGMER